MEIPELTLVRRTLKQFNLDPALALAVLLKGLGDDHLAVIATIDWDRDEDNQPDTTLEAVIQILKREGERNGDAFFKAMKPGMTEDQVTGAPRLAGDLMLLQDVVRDLVGGYADHLDRLSDLQGEAV
ncbi:MAG TPA: hypothetical protein VHS31_09065 [Tepidisphaeraceae bacterium]|jgi:hypothetical protein|nr:hypothetical protein [Tepidisphaeraceae bacterium]